MLERSFWTATLALSALVAYPLLWPVPVRPLSWHAPVATGYVGAHAGNRRLVDPQDPSGG